MLGTVFLAGVATGPVFGWIAMYGGIAFGAQTTSVEISDRTSTYQLLALFGDVFERVRLDYVDPVSDKNLIENALDGMLTGLDPHSGYMNSEAFRDMQAEAKGEFAGLGMDVTVDNGFLTGCGNTREIRVFPWSAGVWRTFGVRIYGFLLCCRARIMPRDRLLA
jgi:carboxyl-terminal processing protease